MPVKKRPPKQASLPLSDSLPSIPAPDFEKLLRKPAIDLPLPNDFDVEKEASHLKNLWETVHQLRTYRYEQFIHAGGSGIVFRVKEHNDLFALGRTIQETLAILVAEFGERCFAAYGFRFLHLIACMLLDGQNAPIKERVAVHDGRAFVADTALDYPTDLFERHRIVSAEELSERLRRFDRDYSWFGRIPELDPWQADIVNTGVVSLCTIHAESFSNP